MYLFTNMPHKNVDIFGFTLEYYRDACKAKLPDLLRFNPSLRMLLHKPGLIRLKFHNYWVNFALYYRLIDFHASIYN